MTAGDTSASLGSKTGKGARIPRTVRKDIEQGQRNLNARAELVARMRAKIRQNRETA